MGYIVLPAQLKALSELTINENSEIQNIELLWLPGFIQLIVWKNGTATTYSINEDGEIN